MDKEPAQKALELAKNAIDLDQFAQSLRESELMNVFKPPQ